MKIAPRKGKKNSEADFERLVAQESLILEVTEEICRILASTKITRQELARRLGKSKGFITQVLSGERNMTLRTASDLAAALDHHFQVKAVPNNKASIGTAPAAYVYASALHFPRHGQSRGAHLGVGTLVREWNEATRQAFEVRASDLAWMQDRWAPATDPVEPENPEGKVHDHEFSLSA